jgi:hypothetical protein
MPDETAELVRRLGELGVSVQIQKLSPDTAVADCSPAVRELLGLPTALVWRHPRPMLRGYNFEIWRCKIGVGSHGVMQRTGWGRSFEEAVRRALELV